MTTWLVLPPIVFGSVDSRQYAAAFPLENAGDLPRDLQLAENLQKFSFGVFLPLFETEPGRPPHPPTAILLHPTHLVIAALGARPRIIPLCNLQYVEYGHFLLQGWIGLWTNGRTSRFPFNTVKSYAVEELMRRLVTAWAPENLICSLAPDGAPAVDLGPKLRYAEAGALGPEEQIVTRFFSRTRILPSRILDGQSPHRNAGDYQALTSRRLVWITERNRGCYEPYGSILRFAPLRNLTDIFVHCSGRNCGRHALVYPFGVASHRSGVCVCKSRGSDHPGRLREAPRLRKNVLRDKTRRARLAPDGQPEPAFRHGPGMHKRPVDRVSRAQYFLYGDFS